MRALALFFAIPALLSAGRGEDMLKSIRESSLDPAQCYRVRELSLGFDEAQIFFTEGFLIFSKPVAGTPISAIFSADIEGGDAEILLMPPDRGERRSLAQHTGSPTLEEHFTTTAMVFAPETHRNLMEQIRANPANKPSAEMGALLSERWNTVMHNLDESFGLRLAADLLSPSAKRKGFFAAAMAGKSLGAFDLVFDPRTSEQLLIGKTDNQNFDVWSSFVSRSYRATPFAPEFALKNFKIDSRLDEDLTLHCVTRVTAVLHDAAEGALPFEISPRMQVMTASIDGRAVEVLQSRFTRSSVKSGANDVFLLAPAEPLAPGPHTIEISHEGKVITEAGNHVYFVGSRGNWYPTRGMQYTTFDLTFRSPRTLDLVAAGEPVSDTVEDDMRVTRRKVEMPIRLAGFNLGQYDRARIKRGDFTIEVCANRAAEEALTPRVPDLTWTPEQPPGMRNPRRTMLIPVPPPPMPARPDPTARLQALASEIAGVMEFYNARFGPLPIHFLEVSPVPGRFGQGFPGMIYLSTLAYLRPSDKAISSLDERSQIFFSDLLHAHEAAHQWWGDVVTSAGYHDDWLMEALANYSALLFLERNKGTKALDVVLEDYRAHLLAKTENGETVESQGPVVQGARLDSGWTSIVYGKGTWIIHMLRKRLGDDAFLRMLAAMRKEFDGQAVSTAQFRAFCAKYLPPKAADAKLEGFFDQWVYGTGVPELKLSYNVKPPAKDAARPVWRVEGNLTASAAGPDFSAETPLEVRFATGRTVIHFVHAADGPNSFELRLPAAPAKITIDSKSLLHR